MTDPKPQTFEEWFKQHHWINEPSYAEAAWNAAQAALNTLCPDCQHPMSIHDNQVDPIPTHCCLVCAEKARVRLAMEQEKAAAVAATRDEAEKYGMDLVESLIRSILHVSPAITGKALLDEIVLHGNAELLVAKIQANAVREGERREAAAEAREKALRQKIELELELSDFPEGRQMPLSDRIKAILEETQHG